MLDFPPVIPDFLRSTAPAVRGRTRAFGAPDLRGPHRFLGWTLRQQLPTLVFASLVAVVEFVPGALGPYLVGRIVDTGIVAGDPTAVWQLSGLLLIFVVVGVGAGIARHSLIVRSWLVAMYATIAMVSRKAAQLGHVLPQRHPDG